MMTRHHLFRHKSRRLTEKDAVEIHILLEQGMLQHEIAALYGVNQGRISEIKNGKRFPGSKEKAMRQLGLI